MPFLMLRTLGEMKRLGSCHEHVGAYAINPDETALPLAGKGQGMHMDYKPKL